MDIRNLDLFEEVDVIQVGARNTQNFDMLKELGKTNKPILLKRGLAGTIKELLMSAEYIMANGNENVILCERGIRTYESTYTRNTLDLSVVPVLKGLTHLPVVVDPSHGTGHAYLVEPMAMAAAAAGADGIMIEVHNDPPHALCDGAQSLTPGAVCPDRPENLPDSGGDAGMTVGIIGLGLIGGSLAKAYRRDPSVTVLGWDTDRSITEFAQIAQAIHAPLTEERLGELDLLLLATYPEAVVEHMERLAPKIAPHTMVIDCAGTKEKVCQKVFPLAEEYGFPFLGGHPMAGTHFSGFKYSRADLFDGAPMVLVPPTFDDIRLLDRAKKLLEPVGFGRVSITTAEKHDQRIAFTSQMAHVISNAYIKSPTAREHDGFSAGSYKDLTRVAWLNPSMWAELFLENKKNLLFELDTLIGNFEPVQAGPGGRGLPHPLPPAGRGPPDQGGGGREMTRVHVTASPAPTRSPLAGGCWPRWGQTAAGLWKGRTAAVVSDTHVAPLYLDQVKASLEGGGVPGAPLRLPRRGGA